MRMSLQGTGRTPARLRTRQLVLMAFVIQASASVAAWFVVNDRSRGRGVWSTADFREWATVSAVCAALLVVLAGLARRRWLVASAVAAGTFLALALGIAVFVAWAVTNSA